jgi:ATP-dependent Zn protease
VTGTQPLKAVAYHEAGHAVAQWAVGQPIDYATIVPSEGTLGHVALQLVPPSLVNRSGHDFTASELEMIEDVIIVLLAGAIAEMQHYKLGPEDQERREARNWGAKEDRALAAELADVLNDAYGSPGDLDTYLDLLTAKTFDLVRSNREVIEMLASELLTHRTLSGSAVRRVLGSKHPG